jgi:hypothetical protein
MAVPVKIVAMMSDGKKSWVPFPEGASPSEIASAVEAYLSANPVDLSGKVDKVTGSSLVADTEIAKIHSVATEFSGLAKITVGSSAPAAPGIGDLWIDTN